MKNFVTFITLLLIGINAISQTEFSDTIYSFDMSIENFNECHAADSFYVIQSSTPGRKGFLKLDLNGSYIYGKHYGDSIIGTGSIHNNLIIWKPDKFINVTTIRDTTINYSNYTSLICFDYNFNVIWKEDYKPLHQQSSTI